MDILQVCGVFIIGLVSGFGIALAIGRYHARSVIIAHIDPKELADRLVDKP